MLLYAMLFFLHCLLSSEGVWGSKHLLNSGVLRNDNWCNEVAASPTTLPEILYPEIGGGGVGRCSLTITVRGAGSERDPLPSKSQNLCPFLATSTRVVWGFASLNTFIFTKSFVSLLWTILRAFVLNTKDYGDEHVKAILLLCHWINWGHSEYFTGIHCEVLFLILKYTWFTVLC